jgi:hypothetical protein
MTKPKIYVSYPFGKKVMPSDYMRLELIKDKLRKKYQPYSALDIPSQEGITSTESKLMKLVTVNNVYMCHGWEQNENCQTEYGVALRMGKTIHLEEIARGDNVIETINDIMGVDIIAKRTNKKASLALMILSKVLHERGWTIMSIGNYLGRNHVTILQFLRQYAKKAAEDSYFANLDKTLRMYI